MTEKISREAYEAFIREVCNGAAGFEQMIAWGFSIKPCDCNYDGCQGWIFTPDNMALTMGRLTAEIRERLRRDAD